MRNRFIWEHLLLTKSITYNQSIIFVTAKFCSAESVAMFLTFSFDKTSVSFIAQKSASKICCWKTKGGIVFVIYFYTKEGRRPCIIRKVINHIYRFALYDKKNLKKVISSMFLQTDVIISLHKFLDETTLAWIVETGCSRHTLKRCTIVCLVWKMVWAECVCVLL